MNEKNKEGSKALGEFCKMMIKHSPCNVQHPMPLIEEKAKKRLTTDGMISFKLILKEWEKCSPEDKKNIARLLLLNANTVVEVMDASHDLLDETKDVFDYLNEHPEYQGKNDSSSDSMLKDLENLLGL